MVIAAAAMDEMSCGQSRVGEEADQSPGLDVSLQSRQKIHQKREESMQQGRVFQGGKGPSLVVQWLRLQAPNAGGPASISSWGTSSHMPQPRLVQSNKK